jgi:hypothetical protein
MINLKVRPIPHLSTRYYLEYFDTIQQMDIYRPVAKEAIESIRTIIQKRFGISDVKLITIYLDVEVS